MYSYINIYIYEQVDIYIYMKSMWKFFVKF